MPTISVNILNYNTFERTKSCIESCLCQNIQDFRVLLIDNNSTDDSFVKLQNIFGDRIDYLQTGSNYGYAKGNNIGVKYSKKRGFRYSLILNSDTELVGSNVIYKLYSVFLNYSDCGIAAPQIFDVTQYGLLENLNDSSYHKILRILNILPKNIQINGFIKQISEAHGSALMVANDAFLKIGGFSEHYFMYCEESLFSKKILWEGLKIYWYRDGVNYVLHHHDTTKRIDSWRFFLMGRNISLEYFENRKGKSKWLMAYIFLILNILFRSIFIPAYRYMFQGLIKGCFLSQKKLSNEELFQHGKSIRDNGF